MDEHAVALIEGFRTRTLPKAGWTHEAHVTVCWESVTRLGARASLDELRIAIRAYNESVGTVNSPTGGYHETVTRYYVEAVGFLTGRSLSEVLAHELCGRTSPLHFWSEDVLYSEAARARWVPPDRESLPW